MRTLTVVATSLGLAVAGLLAPAVASAACGNEVDSGTLTLCADGLDYTVRSGWLTLGGATYHIEATAIEY